MLPGTNCLWPPDQNRLIRQESADQIRNPKSFEIAYIAKEVLNHACNRRSGEEIGLRRRIK